MEATPKSPTGRKSTEGRRRSSKRMPKELGRKGEEVACTYLASHGIGVLARNWRCRAGEADIIAVEDDDIVFIEVKTRASLNGGLPEDSVTREKRAKYENIAMHYLAQGAHPSSRVRFDVISVVLIGDARAFLRHHRDAFSEGQ